MPSAADDVWRAPTTIGLATTMKRSAEALEVLREKHQGAA